MDPRDFFKKGDELELTVVDRTMDGQGVGKFSAEDSENGTSAFTGLSVFIPDTLPGDRVCCRLQRVRKNYLEARLSRLLQPSSQRIQPPCPYADRCDGCGLMAMNYAQQLLLKKNHIEQQLLRIGELGPEEIRAFNIQVHSENQFHYRNKVNLRLSPGGKLAYSRRGSHDPVEVDQCLVASDAICQLMQAWNEHPLDPDLASAIKMVILRANRAGETMILLILDQRRKRDLEAVFEALSFLHPQVMAASLNGPQDGIRPQKHLIFSGSSISLKTCLEERLGGLRFKLSPASFFQVNSTMAEILYDYAIRTLLGEKEDGTAKDHSEELSQKKREKQNAAGVLDLYCGTGTTSLFLAQKVQEVVGVEWSQAAVRDAKENARFNSLRNVRFIRSRAEDMIEEFIKTYPAFNSFLVDPPRAGLDKKVVEAINRSQGRRLLYISCNPSTLARDIRAFRQGGFQVQSVQGFDMFPNSDHVETVCLMSREN